MWADDLKSICFQPVGSLGANQKGHVTICLSQTTCKIATDGPDANDQNLQD
jgi:hypothetical protein